jgi:hypothetical protein
LAAFPSSQTWNFVHSPSNRRNNPFSLPLSSNQNRGYQNYGDCKKNYTPAPFITRRNIFAGASGLTACVSIFPALEPRVNIRTEESDVGQKGEGLKY